MMDTKVHAISILLPTYNGAAYLAEQLNSILAQTFADFELLVIDDGSIDSTPQILENFSRRDRRVRILPSSGNRGQKQRLIELVAAASAPLIAISDQDDVWHSEKLARLKGSIGKCALAFGRSVLIDGEGRHFDRTVLGGGLAIGQIGSGASILFRPQVSGHALLARRDLLADDVFESQHPYDWLISLRAAFAQGIAYDDDAVVFHRLHSSNAHNGGLLLRVYPLRTRPKDILQGIQRAMTRPKRFIDGLEFLAASPMIAAGKRRAFADLAEGFATFRQVPFLKRMSRARGMRQAIFKCLEPYINSSGERRMIEDHAIRLTLGYFHPLTLMRLHRLI